MRAAILSVVFLLPMALATARAGELEDRQAIMDDALSLFLTEQFVEIDRVAEQYRADDARTGSGVWKLTRFYDGIENVTAGLRGHYGKALIEDVDRRYQRWFAQNPDSVIAQIAYAGLFIDRAWLFRGSGFARDVAPEAWAPFRANLATARRHLMDHKQTASIDPMWYVTMLIIATGEGWSQSEFQALLDEATAAHPYFYEIYFKALEYLLPKWHGDIAMIEEFANYAVERTQDEEGMGMYARIYWYASQTQYGGNLFVDTQVTWRKMAAGIDDVLERYPNQWNINNFARFACIAGDRERTLALIARIDDGPILEAWGDSAAGEDLMTFRQCRDWRFQ